MGDYSINNIVSALRGTPSTGDTAALAEKQKAAKLLELQAEQARIDKANETAREFGFTLQPDVIVNGIPVEKSIPAAVDEAELPAKTVAEPEGIKETLIANICETRWAQEADDDPTRKAEFMANCIASKGKTGYSLLQ